MATTSTMTASTTTTSTLLSTRIDAPTKLPINLSQYPKLNPLQAGHLRHYHNLVTQPDGSWNHMGTLEPMQEWEDAYRYQLATMCYASAVTHYHRLPALRSVFRALIRAQIHKMLRKEVWGYWFMTSHSGAKLDPGRTELRKPWADPVREENIMYSGHLLLMTSLYGMLFDEGEFEEEADKTGEGEEEGNNQSIVFKWDPLFWGMGDETFRYSNRSLQKVILDQMRRNEWVGCACEPNAVFVVCNQFPILAMRLNDSRDGTNVVGEVLEKYKAALEKKGMLQADGLWSAAYLLNQKRVAPSRQGNHTAWNNSFMNAWNSEFVRANWRRQSIGHLVKINDKTTLQSTNVAAVYRRLVAENGGQEPENVQETLDKAHEAVEKGETGSPWPFQSASRGLFMMMLSELGQKDELQDLLEFADRKLNPTWERGGLFYPRNDAMLDAKDDFVHVEPHSGNSAIGYARLNVEDGQKKIWEQPWTREWLSSRPYVEGVTLGDDIDFLRGAWDEDRQALIVTVRAWEADLIQPKPVSFAVRALKTGDWAVYVDGELQKTHYVEGREDIEVQVSVPASTEVDVVVLRLSE